ncbi:hypothetical protein DRQ50_00240 [bacterium]|nr:MAG: hypothetical protein DRQ50_00240 [bacterium]
MGRALRGEPLTYIDALPGVAEALVKKLKEKDEQYGGSWLKRGGVGAFMMMARKWDRLEQRVASDQLATPPGQDDSQAYCVASKWDILEHARSDRRDEGVIDDLEDLAAYLLLVLSELKASDVPKADTVGFDTTVSHPFGYEKEVCEHCEGESKDCGYCGA